MQRYPSLQNVHLVAHLPSVKFCWGTEHKGTNPVMCDTVHLGDLIGNLVGNLKSLQAADIPVHHWQP